MRNGPGGNVRGARAGFLSMVSVLMLMASCAAPSRGPAVPSDLEDRATVLSMPEVRTWEDVLNPAFKAEMMRSTERELELQRRAGQTGPLPHAYFLAISGGGSNGAYGAGLLCGWTAAGTRPEFKFVTGISTGALTAPFAFCGPKYDDRLRKVYTTVKSQEIATSRGMLAALFSDAMMDTTPLVKLMDKLIDEEMMRDIAREYARGRVLFVATTDLDADRGVVWNVGAIAASGKPGALKLLHQVLLASAAIPGAFPPVMIDVEADGKHYQEMHVDGGARAQMFLYPPSFRMAAEAAARGVRRERTGYLIRNSRLDPEWADTQRKTLPIAMRAIGSMIQTQGIGDIFRIFLVAQRDGVDFNLAYIPPTFREQPAEDFDPVYMSKLFQVGYDQAKNGYPWEKSPPGYVLERVAPIGEATTKTATTRPD